MTKPRTLGQTIKEARAAQKLSQEGLAKKVGIKQPSLSVIESDQNGAKPETLKKLEEVLGVDLSAFYPGPKAPEGPAVDTGKVSEYGRITLRLPPSDLARLDVLTVLEKRPSWKVLKRALDEYWERLKGEDRALAETLLKRALARKEEESGRD